MVVLENKTRNFVCFGLDDAGRYRAPSRIGPPDGAMRPPGGARSPEKAPREVPSGGFRWVAEKFGFFGFLEKKHSVTLSDEA